MAKLTGIKLRLSRDPARLRVTLQAGHALTDGLGGLTYGADQGTFPNAYADDPAAEILGTLDNGRPGLVLKNHGTWTAIHSAAPLLPAPLLLRLAQHAGVHLYLDTDDVVWATRQMLAVSVQEGGPRTIHLPREANVRDLYQGKPVARRVRSFQADLPDRGTRVFALE
jgi:hypothetical protein